MNVECHWWGPYIVPHCGEARPAYRLQGVTGGQGCGRELCLLKGA